MSAILGWSQLLKSGRVSVDEVQEAAEIIARNAAAQAKALDNLLELNHVLAGKLQMEIQTVALQPIVDAAIRAVRSQMVAKKIGFKKFLSGDASPVRGDPARLSMIANHLLSNAVRLAPENGTVDVELMMFDADIRLVVKHTIGTRRTNGHSAGGSEPDDTGVGFVIVKHLVALHGGTFEVIGGPTSDAEYRCTFKAAKPDAQTEEASPDEWPDVDLSGKRLLVVEDDEDTRAMLAFVLEGNGAEVVTAVDGKKARQLLEEGSYNLVVSDIGLPEMNGIELIQEIRSAGCTIPCVALTAYTSSADRTKALESGFDMFVSKPVDTTELLRIVGRCVSGSL